MEDLNCVFKLLKNSKKEISVELTQDFSTLKSLHFADNPFQTAKIEKGEAPRLTLTWPDEKSWTSKFESERDLILSPRLKSILELLMEFLEEKGISVVK